MSTMSVYNAHRPSLIGLPMEPLKGDAVERMSIGTLDEPDETAAERRRQRFRVAAGACALLFAATLALRVAAARPRAPTTDEWALDWDLAAELRAATAAAGGALAPLAVARATYAGGCLVLEAPRTAPPAAVEGDPFAAEALDSALVVRPAVFGGGYALVLNKFPAFPDHALLITAAAVPQARRLDRDDLDALHRCASVAARVQVNFSWNLLDGVNNVTISMQAAKGLGFYNSDATAGASQPHRHFQIVPGSSFVGEGWDEARPPISRDIEALPRNPWRWSGRVPFRPVAQTLPRLAGVAHGVVLLPPRATFRVDFSTDGAFADALLRAYALLLHDLDLLNGESHNLLVGRGWLLVVARRAREANGVDVNALGFAGCLLARDAATFESLLTPGACGDVLRGVAVSG